MTQASAPVVSVPVERDLANEPAVTIGGMFADKVMVKTIVTAAVGVISLGAKFVVTDQQIEDIATIVTFIATIATMFMAQYEARQRAHAQASKTREAVYAPTTVAAIATQAVEAGNAEIVNVPRGAALSP